MSGAWHIVGKDVRRMAVPTALWVAFVVGSTMMFWAGAEAPEESVARAFDAFEMWSRLLVAMQLFTGFMLAGAMVLEDPLVGTDVFWATRPIGRGRLLGAKLTGATLLFAVAPTIAMTGVWLAAEFDVGELGLAVVEFMIHQGLITLFALLTACLVRNLAGFLACAVAMVVLQLGTTAWGAVLLLAEDLPAAVRRSQNLVQQVALVLGAAGVIAHQFLTRRRDWSWVLLGLVLVGAPMLAQSWRWNFALASAARVEDGRIELRALRIEGRTGAVIPSMAQRKHRVPTLTVETWERGTAGEFFVPVNGTVDLSWRDGMRATMMLSGARAIPSEAVRATAVGEAWPERRITVLKMRRISEPEVRLPNEPATVRGEIELAVYRPRILGQMPVRKGSRLEAGSNSVQVRAIDERTDGTFASLLVEEREAYLRLEERMWNVSGAYLGLRRSRLDYYVLRLGEPKREHVLIMEEPGAVSVASRVIGARKLGLPAGITAEQLERAVLVKVRFELEREERRALHATDVEIIGDPKA